MPRRRAGSCSGGRGSEAASSRPSAERVEAPFLQLVMERLWRATVAAGLPRADALPARRARRRAADRREPPARGTRRAHAATSRRLPPTSSASSSRRSRTKIAHPASDLAEWTQRPEPEVEAVLDKLCRGESGRILRRDPPSADGRGRNALRALPRRPRPASARVEYCNVARNERSRGSSRSGTSAARGSKGSSWLERPPSQSSRSSSASRSSNVRMRRSGHVRRRHEASTPPPSGSSRRTPS